MNHFLLSKFSRQMFSTVKWRNCTFSILLFSSIVGLPFQGHSNNSDRHGKEIHLNPRIEWSGNIAQPNGNKFQLGARKFLNKNSRSSSPAGFTAAGIDLSLTKTANQVDAVIGDTVTFTLLVENHDAIQTATGVTVSDPIPYGTSFVSAGTGYDANTGLWTIASIAPGGSVSVQVSLKIIADGVIYNLAEIQNAPPDPDLFQETAICQKMTLQARV